MLCDTNIIIYSLNQLSPKRTIAQKFLRSHKNRLCIAHQNIFEALRVLTHPTFPRSMPVIKAIKSVEGVTKAISVISPTGLTVSIAQSLIKKHKLHADRVFDAYLVATMLSHSITTIATDNEKHFKIFKHIRVHNPFRK